MTLANELTTAGLPLYIPPDILQAHDDWGANCGPAALSAITRKPLAELRSAIEPFRGYMAFADMVRSLTNLHFEHVVMRKDFKLLASPVHRRGKDYWHGRLTLIQFGGKWLDPGIHPGAALSRTHWIAVRHRPEQVYDINAGECGDWLDFDEWELLAKVIMKEIPRCDGKWSVRSTILVRGKVE